MTLLAIIIYHARWGGCMIYRRSLGKVFTALINHWLWITAFQRLLCTDISSLGEEKQNICQSGWNHRMPVNYLLRSTFDKSRPAKYYLGAYGAAFNVMIHQEASKIINWIYLVDFSFSQRTDMSNEYFQGICMCQSPAISSLFAPSCLWWC